MDLSLRERPLRAVHAAPDLRVFDIVRLLLHEEPDPVRAARLRDAFCRDGVVRNPPVAALMPGGRATVLDGANRVTALRDLGVPHAVAQVVPYDDPAIVLSTWRHYVREDGCPRLRERAASLHGVHIDSVSEGEAAALLDRREAIAAIVDEQGALLMRNGGDPVRAAEALGRFVALYRGRRQIYRIDGGVAETLRANYGPGTLVIFPPFEKEEILRIAEHGGRLPTGITRHVIPGRALRVNTPIEWLGEPSSTAEKQTALEADLHRRWLDLRVRYYAEPTYLFDE
jgi:hypothetical protein